MCLPMMIEAEPIVFFLLSVICAAHCFLFSCQRSGYEVYILEATYKDPAVSLYAIHCFSFSR